MDALTAVPATTPVTITDVPVAGLSATNDSPTTLGQATHLTATVTAGTNVTYSWDLGDGSAELTTGYTTGSGATPAHTYTGAGAYTAVVTAGNSANALTTTTPITIVASEALVTRTITDPSTSPPGTHRQGK